MRLAQAGTRVTSIQEWCNDNDNNVEFLLKYNRKKVKICISSDSTLIESDD